MRTIAAMFMPTIKECLLDLSLTFILDKSHDAPGENAMVRVVFASNLEVACRTTVRRL
jgi:hypothetical protein